MTLSFFNSWVLFCCLDIPQLLYPPICSWHLGCFRILALVNSAVMNMGVQRAFLHCAFVSIGYILMTKITGSYRAQFPISLRNVYIVFQKDWAGPVDIRTSSE